MKISKIQGLFLGGAMLLAGFESVLAQQRDQLKIIQNLNKSIGKYKQSLKILSETPTVFSKDKKEKRVSLITLDECRLKVSTIHSTHPGGMVLKSEEKSFHLSYEKKPFLSTVHDEKWGPGLQLIGSRGVAVIFYPKRGDRDQDRQKLNLMAEKCHEKLYAMNSLTQYLLNLRRAEDYDQCAVKENGPKGFLGGILSQAEETYIQSWLSHHQNEDFNLLLQEYQDQFSSVLDPLQEEPVEVSEGKLTNFRKWSLRFLKMLKNDPRLIRRIRIPLLAKIKANIVLAAGTISQKSGDISMKQELQSALENLFSPENKELLQHLISGGLFQEIHLEGHFLSKEVLSPSAALKKLALEENIVQLNGPDKGKTLFPQVTLDGEKRVKKLVGIFQNQYPEIGNSSVEFNGSLGPLRQLTHAFKKAKLREFLDTFNLKFNVFRDKDLQMNPKDVDTFAEEFLDFLIDSPNMVRAMDLDQVVDVLKMITVMSGHTSEIGSKIQKLLLKKSDFILSLLLLADGNNNAQVWDLYKDQQPVDEKRFFEMMKRENDIVWLVTVRNQMAENLLSILKSNKSPLLEREAEAQRMALENFGNFFQTSNFRTGLLLSLFKKTEPLTWEKAIAKSTSGGEIDLERDFEHYGRWGVAGDIMTDMVKYEKKLEEKPEWKGRKVLHDILVKTVLENRNRSTNLSRLMEFAKQLSLDHPNLKTTAFQEIGQLYSDVK